LFSLGYFAKNCKGVQKGKICLFARASQALFGRGAVMPRPKRYLVSSSGKADEPLLKTFFCV
jgi:hypothetical protein